MKNGDTHAAWFKFEFGDQLSDEELLACIAEAKTAVAYMTNRGGIYSFTRIASEHDLYLLEGFAKARELVIP